jgi:glycosyltransferase involved in cell wall biosynthesis
MITRANWYGWSNPRSGYGIVNLEYSTALNRLLKGGVSYGWERVTDILPMDFQQLTEEQKELLTKPYVKEKIGVIKTTPPLFYMNTSEFRIGYTMVENTRIGDGWVNFCNNMDGIFVPSQFLVQVFQECGVKKPIKVVKQGINSKNFPFINRPNKEKFVFGTVGYIDDRKNWKDMVQAFCSEFEPDEPVELWIKNANVYFAHNGFTDPRIKVINRFYTPKELHTLYGLFDCFLCPSHAEGSCLPAREAMATGLPVILTNWSGLSEIANYGYPLTPVAIDYPDIRGAEQPGFMARLDVQELMYYMRYVYEHRNEAKAKGITASKYIHENWEWNVCAKDLLSKLEEF